MTKRAFAILLPLLLLWGTWTQAQGGVPLVAFTNASEQLVIATPDGGSRWIVTHPGETLNAGVPLQWTNDGALLFAVSAGNITSLRRAVPSTQALSELTQLNANVQSGAWLPNGAGLVFVSQATELAVWDARANATNTLANGALSLALSADGTQVAYRTREGYALTAINRAAPVPLNGQPLNNAQMLWAERAPLLAYTALAPSGMPALYVVNATNGVQFMQESSSSAPILPLLWLPADNLLLYRSSNGILALDSSCLAQSCDGIAPANVLPVTANALNSTPSGALVYTLNGAVYGASTLSAAPLALDNTSPSALYMGGEIAIYTSGNGNIHAVDVGCVARGGCPTQMTGTAGNVLAVSDAGRYVLYTNGNRLLVLDLTSGRSAELGTVGAGVRANWNG